MKKKLAYIIIFFIACEKQPEREPIILNIQVDMRQFPGHTTFTIYNHDTAYVFDSNVKKYYETFIPDTGRYSIQWEVSVSAETSYEACLRSFEREVLIPYENYIFVGHNWPVHTVHYFTKEKK